jgi:hypothetical protein
MLPFLWKICNHLIKYKISDEIDTTHKSWRQVEIYPNENAESTVAAPSLIRKAQNQQVRWPWRRIVPVQFEPWQSKGPENWENVQIALKSTAMVDFKTAVFLLKATPSKYFTPSNNSPNAVDGNWETWKASGTEIIDWFVLGVNLK